MTQLNTQAQIIELTDDQLELVEGGLLMPLPLEPLIPGQVLKNAWKALTDPNNWLM